MHNIEHKPAQEEPSSSPEQKAATRTEKQKLPRAWRYILIGGMGLLVLAVIFAGVLSLANQRAKQSPVTGTTPTIGATALPTSTIGATTLPTPASTPIRSPALSDHTVNTTIADGVAYLSTSDSSPTTLNNAVFALRTSNGALLWHQKIEGSADQAPLVANGVVYVTTYVGLNGPVYVYALRASDGNLLWRYSNANYSYLSLSTSDSNVVFVASPDGISALNASNGASLWHYAAKDTGSTWPLEVNGVVYFSSSSDNGSGTLYALRATDGSPIWQYKTGSYTNYFQSLQLVNGVLYTTTTKILEPPAAHSANPLQAATDIGALLWNTLQNAPAVRTIPLKQGISSVYAIRASDGAVLWHYAMNNGANSWASWLAVENGVVYADAITDTTGSQGLGDIYALQSSNGSALWHDKLNRSPENALLANDIIYLSTSSGSLDGTVYALRARDGSMLWDYPLSGPMYAAPVLDGTTVYVGAGNGMVYALRADNGKLLWYYFTGVGG